MGLVKESGTIEKRHQLFTNNPRYVKSIREIGTNDLWTRVYDAHLLFETRYTQRQQLRLEFNKTLSASKAADKVRQKWTDIFHFIQSAYAVEERPEYIKIASLINEEIDTAMKTLQQRTSISAKKRMKNSQSTD